MSDAELVDLRRRVKAQRTELRRLNQRIGAYWHGFRECLNHDRAMALRVKMIAAFGHEAVFKAEQETVTRDRSGKKCL